MWKKITSLKFNNWTNRKNFLILGGVLVFLISVFAVTTGFYLQQQAQEAKFIPDEIIVKIEEENLEDENFNKQIKALGVASVEKLYNTESAELNKYYKLKLKQGSDVLKAKEQIEKLKGVKNAEPNYEMEIMEVPNDPMYNQLWGLSKIDMPNAWSMSKGSKSVTVAVVDTGIDRNHPDLAPQISSFVSCLSGSCKEQPALDDHSHGTHVSGTIGAVTNNSQGIAGINWDVSLMGVKVMDSKGKGDTANIAAGIIYAVEHGAKVINLSLGGQKACSAIPLYQDAINLGLSKGVTIVVAAGNSKMNASGYAPASCDGVITVGSTTSSDSRSSFSNFGSVVEIAAPGSDILSAVPGGGYAPKSGTSMATPHVVGVAALLLSVNPGLSPSQVSDCITQNADTISTDQPIGPRLNALKVLNACSGLTPISPVPISPDPSVSNPPGISQTPTNFSIHATIFNDQNGNSKKDPGEGGFGGVPVALTGAMVKNQTTDSTGETVFSGLKEGTFGLTFSYSGQTIKFSPDLVLTSLIPTQYAFLAVQSSGKVVPVTPIPTPTIGAGTGQPSIIPTSPPNSSPPARISIAPSGTAYKPANCYFDPKKCISGLFGIQQCTLVCTPK